MEAVAISVFCVFFVISFVVFRKLGHPAVVFNLIWGVFIAISTLGLAGLSIPGQIIYFYLTVGGTVFNTVMLLFAGSKKLLHIHYKEKTSKKILSAKVKHGIVITINIIMLFYYIYKLTKVINVIGAGSYYDVRGFYYSSDNFSSSLEYNMVTFVFDPMLTVTSIIFAINMFDKHYSTFSLAVMFFNVALRMVVSGGRMIMFEFAACIIVAYFATYKYRSKIRRTKREHRRRIIIGIVLTGAIIAAAYITELRGGQEDTLAGNAFSTFVSNFTGSFSYFDVLNKNHKYVADLNGRATFAGIIDPFIMLARFFKITDVDIAQNTVGNVLSEFYLLGKHSYNAMPTMYYFFKTDFGNFGMVIGPVILSIYCYICEKGRRQYKDYKHLGLFMLMMLAVIESSMTWLPFKTSFIMANIFTAILLTNDKIRD